MRNYPYFSDLHILTFLSFHCYNRDDIPLPMKRRGLSQSSSSSSDYSSDRESQDELLVSGIYWNHFPHL